MSDLDAAAAHIAKLLRAIEHWEEMEDFDRDLVIQGAFQFLRTLDPNCEPFEEPK